MKKYRYCLLVIGILFFTILLFSHIDSKYHDVKYVYHENDLKCKFSISNITEKTDQYEILIYYPVTEYSKLNKEINNMVKKYKEQFKTNLKESGNRLTIHFDHYEYESYVSFVWNVQITGNVEHGENYVDTINFDVDHKKIITIEEILNKDPSNFTLISEYVLNVLCKDVDILKYGKVEQVREYLTSGKEYYRYFYFKNNTLVICFNEGTIAPKVAGIFHIPIPITSIKLS